MADMEYRVDYDEAGLKTSQHILEIGTEDRVRFVTTPKTVQYLEAKKWRLALKRDPASETPFNGLADPYIVPVHSAAQWIAVEHRGKNHKGKNFHWDCGYLDEHNKFYKWPEPAPTSTARAHVQGISPERPANSLPFPI